MTEVVSALAIGLAGSAHCIGMCGGFAAAIGAAGRPTLPSMARQMVYSCGRIFTYICLGAVGGFAGLYLSRFHSALISAQQVFAILAGLIMLLLGLSILGLVRFRLFSGSTLGELAAPMFRHFLDARGWFGFFLAGLANGLLPCGLVYAVLAMAVGTGGVGEGMLVMGVFGAGTVPAMVAVGCGSALVGQVWRTRVHRLAACFVIAAGGATIWRGLTTRLVEGCAESHATVQRTTWSPSLSI